MTSDLDSFIHANPQIRTLRVAACDLNGQARGKRMPMHSARALETDGTRFPLSVMNLDIRGEDIEDSPLVFESGDRDGTLFPSGRGVIPAPWVQTPTALMPIWMFTEAGQPYRGDPRHALAAVLDRYRARGLTPVAAVELEFFLIDDTGETPDVPMSPRSGKRRRVGDILSMRALDAFDGFFTELYDGAEAMGIPTEAAISEAGLGQFEVTLLHQPDALKVADDAWLFKMLARGLARNHGFAASFMAKPYPDTAGNGMHVHFSLLDETGRNVFDDGSEAGSDLLRHAVAGCLNAMQDSALIFAPHANSYTRLQPESHAPTGVCWAYENRTAAVRIPSGAPQARRIEHRVAGGDVNPYLLLAAILGAALTGIEDAQDPPAPLRGNAYAQDMPRLPTDWGSALHRFRDSNILPRIFPPELLRNFALTKQQELDSIATLSDSEQLDLYLDTV